MAKNAQQLKALTLQEFEQAAAQFDNDDPSVYNMCREDYPDIVQELEREPFNDVLDAGSGTGAVLALLAADHPQANYTGIDLSPRMVAVAQSKAIPGARFVCGDCEQLPFAPGSFDVIVCSQSFHHYPNPELFFASCARVLRPGGRLLIRDMSPLWPIRFLVNHVELPVMHLLGKGDVHCYGRWELERLCAGADLTLERFERRSGMRMHCLIRKKVRTAQQQAFVHDWKEPFA